MHPDLKKILRAVSLELRHTLEGDYDDQSRFGSTAAIFSLWFLRVRYSLLYLKRRQQDIYTGFAVMPSEEKPSYFIKM